VPRAQRRFGRAAPTYLAAARLESEVGARMLERLDYVRVAPARILDAGCGPAPQAAALRRRGPVVKLRRRIEVRYKPASESGNRTDYRRNGRDRRRALGRVPPCAAKGAAGTRRGLGEKPWHC